MPTIEVDTNALLRFTSLFEYGIEKASTDFSGLLLEAATYIEYLQHTGDEALRLKADLERELAETQQYLAVAEGQAEGGPPGWEKVGKHGQLWLCIVDGARLSIQQWNAGDAWEWHVRGDCFSDETYGTYWGHKDTACDAMAAAEAAYQEAIND